MYLRRKKRLKRRNNKKRIVLVCFGFAVVAVLTVVDFRLRGIVRVCAEDIVERRCFDAINSACDNAIESSGLTYSDIVKIERNENNVVTAVMSDVACVNKIKTKTTTHLLKALNDIDDEKVLIPLGTVTGSNYFVGRGPNIKVKTQLTGNSEVEIRSVFESAGINQTRHIIVMDIKCRVYIVMLGTKTAKEISLTVPIAETIIVGTVPDTFLSLSQNAVNN